MRKYSIDNIKHLYGWLDENPNGRMPKDGYSVIVFDCDDLAAGDGACGFTMKERIFASKEEAWLFFYNHICGSLGRDFWDYVDWNDNCVVSTFYDGGGWTHMWIEKWDGFDKDVEVSWEYDGKRYKSIKDLWKGAPIFEGRWQETDEGFIRSKLDDGMGTSIAQLSIDLSDSFNKSCEEKKEELRIKKEEEERHRKELEEKWQKGEFTGDLPF